MRPRRSHYASRSGGPRQSTRQAALDALAVLRDEVPATYRAVAARLKASPASLLVDGETLGLQVVDGIVQLRAAPPSAPLLIASVDRAGVIQLVDGTATMEELLGQGRLQVRGHPDALLAFLSAARAFADASTRSSALQQTFERYRGHPATR